MILIACGLKREAGLFRGEGVVTVAGGGDPARLEAELEAHAGSARAIVSLGLAGGLAPLLAAGDWVVGTVAPSGAERREWSVGAGAGRQGPVRIAGEASSNAQQSEFNRAWINRLARTLPGAMVGRIHADGAMIAYAAEKRERHAATRAIACDMESHIAARVAARHDLPFAVARVVCDPAHRSLPHAARVGMGRDGGLAAAAIALSVLTRPWQIPKLIALARDAAKARRALKAGFRLLAQQNFCL
ncbi:phosphorylase family protein [Sphingomonas morindae]|uniref:Phosphorylase n=1 Tax=Sphingomonas morindae TaxID=1541170 RepID=A0ABY4X451_9SPHN|nr:phosphorylase [Sphingomonas morindae]USI71668.1 phosphorylase [Sphingomonas morindae]